MPRLSKSFLSEKYKGGRTEVQEIIVTANTDRKGNFDSYDDVEVNLFLDGRFIGDISHSLAETKQLEPLVDSINWQELAASITA